MLIFSFPTISTFSKYNNFSSYASLQKPLFIFINQYANHKSIYFIATTNNYTPALDPLKTDVKIGQRYTSLFITGIMKQLSSTQNNNQRRLLELDNNFFINMIAEDLNKNKPDFVFVDNSKEKMYIDKLNFDFINYYSKNPRFKQAFKSYRYFTSIKLDTAISYEVYSRI